MCAEPAGNPYLTFVSQILGGLDGLERVLAARPPVESTYESEAVLLPKSLVAAIERFEAGGFYREALGEASCCI